MSEREKTPLLKETRHVDTFELKKKISLLNGITIIVGNMIGSGIFLTPKGVQQSAGSPGLSLIIWSVCAGISFTGAICYAELGTTIVESGGTYSYLIEAFGPYVGFIRLWVSVLIIEPTSLAISLLILATYLVKPFFPSCDPPFYAVRLLAAAALMLLALINCWSIKLSTKVQDIFTYGKIIALAIIIVRGAIYLIENGTYVGSFAHPWQGTNFGAGPLILAMYSGLYSYSGWDSLNFLVEEMKSPQKNLPLAITISLTTCAVIFLLVNVSYYAVLTPEEITASNAVAVVFAGRSLQAITWAIPIFVSMSCFGSLNASLMTSSRLFFVAARKRQLPDYFAMASPKYYTPVPSIIFTVALTFVYLCVNDVFDLIKYYTYMQWLSFAGATAGLIYLRYSRPELPRPFKRNILFSLFFFLICLALVVVPFYSSTIESLIGLGIILSSGPIYFYFIYLSPNRRPEWLHIALHKATCFLQKVFPVILTDS